MAVLTPRDILQAEFKRVWKGYNPDEVDAFLHRVVGEYETLYRENERLRERIKELEARIDEYSRTERQIEETLALAQRTADDLKEAARKEAEATLKEARAKAQELLEDVRREAREASVRTARLRRDAQEFRAAVGRAAEEFLRRIDQLVSSVEEVDAEPPALVDEVAAGREFDDAPALGEDQ